MKLSRVFAAALALFAATSSMSHGREMHPFPDQNGCILNFSYPAEPTFAVIWTGECVDGKAEGTGIAVLYETTAGIWFMQFVGAMHEGRMAGDKVYVQGSDGARGVFAVSGGERRGEGKMIFDRPSRGPSALVLQFDKDEAAELESSETQAENPETYAAFEKEFDSWKTLMAPELGLNGECDAWRHIETAATALAEISANSAKELFFWPPGPEWLQRACQKAAVPAESAAPGDIAAAFVASPTQALTTLTQQNEAAVQKAKDMPKADFQAVAEASYVTVLNGYDACTVDFGFMRSKEGRDATDAFFYKVFALALTEFGIAPEVVDVHLALTFKGDLPGGVSRNIIRGSDQERIYLKSIEYPLFGDPDDPDGPNLMSRIADELGRMLEAGAVEYQQSADNEFKVILLRGCTQ